MTDVRAENEGTQLRQRSFRVSGGTRRSVRLEVDYWAALEAIAAEQGRTLEALVADADAERGDASLASHLRVYAIGRLRAGRR